MPITAGLLEGVKSAHSRYRADQDRQERILKEREIAEKAVQSTQENERLLVEKETILLAEQKDLRKALENVTRLLEEGDTRLKLAIDAKDFSEIEIAGILIDSGRKKITHVNAELANNADALRQFRKKMKK